MRFHIRERAWTLTEAFVVREDAGNAVFEVRGKFFHIGDDLVIFDRYSGQELARIKQRVLSLMPHYEICRNGQPWASMHEQFRLFGEGFKIETGNGTLHVNGDIWRWNFRSEEHTSELQSHLNLVCRLLLEKKKKKTDINCILIWDV